MKPSRDRPAIAWLSPGTAVIFSYGVAVLCLLFPPAIYERLILEPNRIFANARVFSFVSLCVLAFVAGLLLARLLNGGGGRRRRPRRGCSRSGGAGAPAWCCGSCSRWCSRICTCCSRSYEDSTSWRLCSRSPWRSAPTTEHVLGVFGAGNYWIPAFAPPLVCLGLWTFLIAGTVGTRPERCSSGPPGARRSLHPRAAAHAEAQPDRDVRVQPAGDPIPVPAPHRPLSIRRFAGTSHRSRSQGWSSSASCRSPYGRATSRRSSGRT